MSKSTKVALIVIGIAVMITIGIYFITRGRGTQKTGEETTEDFVDVLSDGTILNNSQTLHKEKKYDGMDFTEIQITSKDNGTMVVGTITNTSKEEKGDYIVDLIMVDKNKNEIGKIPVYIKKLEAGESMQISSTAQGNMSNAFDFNISQRE